MRKAIISISLLTCLFFCSGCILELLELEALEAVEASELLESRMLLAEEEAVAGRAFRLSDLRAGRVAVTSEESVNSLLSDMRISRAAGRNPRLYVKGNNSPIGEVLESERKIRFSNGSVHSIDKNIFAVEGDVVNVRSSTSTISDANIVARLKRGQMVVYLGEVENGWYKVEVVDNTITKTGFISSAFLVPVILADSNGYTAYTYSELKNGIVPFPTENEIIADIVKNGLPDWKFESTEDIQKQVLGSPMLNGDNSYYIDIELYLRNNTTSKECATRVLSRYNLYKNKWKVTSITEEFFQVTREGQHNQYNNEPYAASQGYSRHYTTRPYGTVRTPAYNRCLLKIRLSNYTPICVEIDNRNYNKQGNTITIGDLPQGWHTLKIFSVTPHRNNYSRRTLIFSGDINIQNEENYATYNLNSRQLIVE